VRQLIRAGNESLPLVALIAALMGIILALQSAHQLRTLGATHLVADLVAVSITRELGPLMTAILVAGRVGAAFAAELGTMKVSEEIDALTVIGIDPVHYLVVPRLGALLIAVPCLAVFANLVGILAGAGVGVLALGLGAGGYFADSLAAIELEDLWGGVLKALVFGGIIGLVACQQGLGTRGGADEVGRSTTAAVVRSIVLIIAADMFVTAVLFARH
jgi:phospholipid/cholesterol/gamma-HCH transport system permease protein